MPGVTIRKASEKRASCGLAGLLSACQAISIAMTTVLPVPVAILTATRNRPGFASVARLAQEVRDPGVLVGGLVDDLADVDRGLERLDLGEEQLASRSGSVQYSSRRLRRWRYARPTAAAPETDTLADLG